MEKKVKKRASAAKKPLPKAFKRAIKTEVAKRRYFFAVGRRKTAIVKVKLMRDGSGKLTVNKREFKDYFPTYPLQKLASDPLIVLGQEKTIDIIAEARGGGVASQAQALSLGISRALLLSDPEMKVALKKQGFLTRDARKKERKKPGLKRARRAPQWQKR